MPVENIVFSCLLKITISTDKVGNIHVHFLTNSGKVASLWAALQ